MNREVTSESAKDWPRISLASPDLVEYWTNHFGTTRDQLEDAIRHVGDSVEAVDDWLQEHLQTHSSSGLTGE